MFKTTLHGARDFVRAQLLEMADTKVPAEPVMFHSSPGVGKSEVTNSLENDEEIVQAIEEAFNAKFRIWDWRVGAMQESDIMGIPYPTKVSEDEQGRELKDMMFSTPQNFPREGECGILFLDELSNAPIPNQHACYRLIHDRTVHNGTKLPDGVMVVAAGNTKEDKTGAKSIVPALARRFTAHFKIEPTINDFLEYCFRNKVHDAIMAYISYNPSHLVTSANSGEYGFACPANWVSASKILKNKHLTEDQKKDGATACLGTEVGQEFVGFLDNRQHMPDFEKVKETGEYELPKGASVDRGIMFTIISATAVQMMNGIQSIREEEVEDIAKEKQRVDNLSAILKNFDDTTMGVCFRALKRAYAEGLRDVMMDKSYSNLNDCMKSVIQRTNKMA